MKRPADVLFLDVNVLVGAQRKDHSPLTHRMRSWLDGTLTGPETIGASE